MKIIIVFIASIAIASCSTMESSSGVLPMGDGIYTVSTDFLNAAKAKKAAFDDAIDYCKKSNKSIKVINAKDVPVNRYNLDFICQ